MLAVVIALWWLMDKPVLTMPPFGQQVLRDLWPAGPRWLQIALVATGLALSIGRSAIVRLGAAATVFVLLGFALKIQQAFHKITAEDRDPASAQAVQAIIDGTAVLKSGWLIIGAAMVLLGLALWPSSAANKSPANTSKE